MNIYLFLRKMNEDDIAYKIIYDYIEKSIRNRLVVMKGDKLYRYNMNYPYDIIVIQKRNETDTNN